MSSKTVLIRNVFPQGRVSGGKEDPAQSSVGIVQFGLIGQLPVKTNGQSAIQILISDTVHSQKRFRHKKGRRAF